jgi:hypothetical protein
MREHPRVLTRAVVRQRRIRRRGRDLALQVIDARRVRSASEVVDAASGPPKQVGDGGLVLRLPEWLGAHDGDLLAGQPKRAAPPAAKNGSACRG